MVFGKLLRRCRYWLERDRRAELLREEMEFHLEQKTQQLVDAGMSGSEARRVARQNFGNVARQAEDSRETWISRRLAESMQDLIFATRSFKRQRGFVLVAVLSAALGIGACSTIFAIANFALFRTLAVNEPSRLMEISGTSRTAPGGGDTLSFPDVVELRKANSFSGVAAFFPMLVASVGPVGEQQRNWGALVTANYFDVVRPSFTLGRGFNSSSDDMAGEAPVIVLSHSLWQSRFKGDPKIVGKSVEINKIRATVVGVVGAGFRGTEAGIVSDFWIPFSMIHDFAFLPIQGSSLQDRNNQWLMATGRLAEGANPAQARAELGVVAQRLQKQYPAHNEGRGFHMETAGQINPELRPTVTAFFFLLLGVTILVLLTACANIANLLLARASARSTEMATRLAIGASRGRLIRQLLTESVLLGILGGVAGLGIAYLGTASFGKFKLPVPLPVDLSVSLDSHVVLFCTALSIMTGIVFGLVPALRATKTDLVTALKDEPVEVAKFRRLGFRNVLVIGQVALSTLLLICSGLFLHSLYASRRMDGGFQNRNVLLMSFDPAQNQPSDSQSRQFMKSLLDRTRAMPGVEATSVTDSVPLSFGGEHGSVIPEDQRAEPDRSRIYADIYRVGPDFFKTLGIPILRGKDFAPQPGQNDGLAIVNEALAKRAFPNGDAIGRRIVHGKTALRIVAVVATTKSRTIGEAPRPCLYLPLLDVYQAESDGSQLGITLLVKTGGDPAALVASAKEAAHTLDPAMTIFDVRTLQTHLDNALILPRLAAVAFGICGLMGLLISTIGIYGVVNFSVVRRTKEIGVRMALGAGRGQVLALILRQGLALTGAGCLLGITVALFFGRLARSALYGVSPNDPFAFAVAPLILVLIALAACLIPARRAAGIDPIRSLRCQ